MMQDKKHPCERGVSEKLQSKTAYDVFPVGGNNDWARVYGVSC